MKKKILAVTVVMLVVMTLTVALCGCNATPKNVFGDIPGELYPTTCAAAGELNGTTFFASSGKLAVFTVTDVFGTVNSAVYSMRSGALLTPFSTKTVDINVDSSSGAIYSVTDTTDNSVGYYDSYGTPLAENVAATLAIEATRSYAMIGENVYLLENGKWDGVTHKIGLGWDADVLGNREVSNNYYYIQTGNVIKIYDRKSLKLLSVLNTDRFANAQTNARQVFFLAEDEIVLQYEDVLAADSVRYDVIRNGNKLELRHYIYKVKNGKVKEIKNYGYYVTLATNVESLGTGNIFAKNVKNLIIANKIENGTLSSEQQAYVVNASLKVTKKLTDTKHNISLTNVVSEIGDGYIAYRNDGSGVVMNKKDKVISEIGSAKVYDNCLEAAGTIYTVEGNTMVEKGNYDPNTYTIVSIAENNVLLRNVSDNGVYSCKLGGTPAFIGAAADVNIRLNLKYYTVNDVNGKMTVYALTGKKLGEGYGVFTPIASSVDAIDGVRVLVRVDLGYALLA